MFLSAGEDWDGAPTAKDGVSICMLVLAQDEELLVK
jgi:hypothetical protein